MGSFIGNGIRSGSTMNRHLQLQLLQPCIQEPETSEAPYLGWGENNWTINQCAKMLFPWIIVTNPEWRGTESKCVQCEVSTPAWSEPHRAFIVIEVPPLTNDMLLLGRPGPHNTLTVPVWAFPFWKLLFFFWLVPFLRSQWTIFDLALIILCRCPTGRHPPNLAWDHDTNCQHWTSQDSQHHLPAACPTCAPSSAS